MTHWKDAIADPTHPVWTVARILAVAVLVPSLTLLTSTNYDLEAFGELGRDLGLVSVLSVVELFRRRTTS